MLAIGLLSACAKSPEKIGAEYVPVTRYAGYTCQQIRDEMDISVRRLNALSGKQKKDANTDAMLMGVGLVLFWPALLAMPMTDDNAPEIASLKGEVEALQVAWKSNCT